MTLTLEDRLQENKSIARRWINLISEHKIEELCEITAPTWRMHGGPPNLPIGAAGIRELFRLIGPVEQTWTIEDAIAEGNKVAVRATNRCQQETFLGLDARGVEQIFTATFILQIEDGKVVETWRNADDLGRLWQLGAQFGQKPSVSQVDRIQPEVLQIAGQAFASHQRGAATGDWSELLALMSDDIEFQAPSPLLPTGFIRGKQNVAALLEKATAELKLKAELTLLYPILSGENTVAFEFIAKGQIAGQPVCGQLVVFYEIENGKIESFREYVAKLQ